MSTASNWKRRHKKKMFRNREIHMKKITLDLAQVYEMAGFPKDAQGRVSLPAKTIEEVDASTAKVIEGIQDMLGGPWTPGKEPIDLVITGAGPIWLLMRVVHWIHSRVQRLCYIAPNTPGEVEIFNHGI